MPKLFEDLREKLLTAGIAPRHVRRYLTELRDHLSDLRLETGNEAAALARLGSVEELAKPILAKPELRSLAARYPRTLYGLGPTILWLGLSMGTVALVAILFDPLFGEGAPAVWWYRTVYGLMLVLVRILPILLAAAAVILAIRQRSSLVPPGLGTALILIMSCTMTVELTININAGEHSELQFNWWLAPFLVPFTDAIGPMNVAALVPGFVQAVAIFAAIMTMPFVWRRLASAQA